MKRRCIAGAAIGLAFFFMFQPGTTQKIADLDVLNNPKGILLDDAHIYVTEGPSVFIFSREPVKLLKRFGQAGEGPQEFVTINDMGVTLDASAPDLLVSSLGKLSFFSKSGSFIREQKVKDYVLFFRPMGNHYIGWSKLFKGQTRFQALNIYDNQLAKQKEILTIPDAIQQSRKGTQILNEAFIFRVSGNLLYTATGSDFTIQVRGEDGNVIRTITHPYSPLEVTSQFQDQVVHFLKTDRAYKDFFPFLQPILFPDHFPAIRNFFINGNTIYVVTWKQEKDRTELWVLDLQGKLVRKSWVTLDYENPVKLSPYIIHDDHVFQLTENEQTETWELHRRNI